MKRQPDGCARGAREALRIKPGDALANQDLGDSLIELGQNEEARAEWQRVLQIDRGRCAQEAREMLAKQPQRARKSSWGKMNGGPHHSGWTAGYD